MRGGGRGEIPNWAPAVRVSPSPRPLPAGVRRGRGNHRTRDTAGHGSRQQAPVRPWFCWRALEDLNLWPIRSPTLYPTELRAQLFCATSNSVAHPRPAQDERCHLAERQGFEPWIRLPVYWFSKPAPSASRPPFPNSVSSSGGGGRIRTFGGREPSAVFKTAALDRSATPPESASSRPAAAPAATAPARCESPHIRHPRPAIKREIAGFGARPPPAPPGGSGVTAPHPWVRYHPTRTAPLPRIRPPRLGFLACPLARDVKYVTLDAARSRGSAGGPVLTDADG